MNIAETKHLFKHFIVESKAKFYYKFKDELFSTLHGILMDK